MVHAGGDTFGLIRGVDRRMAGADPCGTGFSSGNRTMHLSNSRLTVLLVVVLALSTAEAQRPDGESSADSSGREPLPRFDRLVYLEDEAATSANVSVGDINGDGNLDIVLAKGRHWPLADRVHFGDGRGGFSAGDDLGAASDRTYSGLLVDLDEDGDLDVVISNDSPDPKLVYLNDSEGRFDAGSAFGSPDWPTRNASAADLNGDGLPDIVVANRTGNRPGANYVCLNRGGGRFDADCLRFSQESATTITPADIDADGRIDLVVPHREGGQSLIYMNEGGAEPTFRAVPFGPPDAAIRVSQAADLDGDGNLDIIAIHEDRARLGIRLYLGEGSQRFSDGVPIDNGGRYPYALAVADLDLDGHPDIVVGNIRAPSAVYFNHGSGRHFDSVTFGDDEGDAYGFGIGDLDNDGRPDIAVARSEGRNVVYFADEATVSAQ
jgi:hypothetical protein